MSITSLVFILFFFASLIVYYIVPKKFQWVVLLVASLVFYIMSSTWGIFFVLITSGTVYGSTLWMDSIAKKQKAYIKENKAVLSREEKSVIKAEAKIKRKRIMIATLVLNFGILCVFKYSHFALDQVNGLASLFGLRTITDNINLPLVLGISFYTFQSMGYVVESYWETVDVQRNYLKVLLFVSFFPQVTQGPISNYAQLSGELFKEHTFTYENYSRGFQRMVWGFFKKMVIADYLYPMVYDVFDNYNQYIGATCLLAAFGYSIEIYADFSGYMDIMCGVCEMFGIRLAENFERPYFSKSIAEYWRRWHITLGEWFKNYIYYPIGVSKWNRNLGKKLSAKFGRTVGKNLPATIALLVVWMTTGLWHGASWAYIAWGLVNGMFIIFSMWMEPVYDKVNTKLQVKKHRNLWKVFQVIRTFVLVTFIKVLPEVGTLKDGVGLLTKAVTDFTIPNDFRQLFPTIDRDQRSFMFIVFMMVILLFVSSIIQRKEPLRNKFNKLPVAVRILVLVCFVLLIECIGITAGSEGGFMYAKF